MRGLVQRVTSASVSVDGVEVGSIGRGLCLFVGVTHTDDETVARKLADKVATLRVFSDDEGAMSQSVVDVGGAVLVVSQFTLYGDASRGRRPSWTLAAAASHAEPLVDAVATHLRSTVRVASGRFGASMHVALVNDGPVTLMIEVNRKP